MKIIKIRINEINITTIAESIAISKNTEKEDKMFLKILISTFLT